MKRLAALAVLGALVPITAAEGAEPLPSARPEQVGLSSEGLDRLGQVLKAGADKGEIPGAVVLVARKGRVAYFESFGFRDQASGAPMPKDAIFRIYSIDVTAPPKNDSGGGGGVSTAMDPRAPTSGSTPRKSCSACS